MRERNYRVCCQTCDREFSASRRDARFCSPACCSAHHRGDKLESKRCARCGEEYVANPLGRRQRFCSRACQDQAYKDSLRAKQTKRVCPVDGTEFYASNNKRFCSRRCGKAYDNAKNRGTLEQLLARGRVCPEFDCAWCDKHCVPGDNVAAHATKFCGYDCKTEWHRHDENGAMRRWQEEHGSTYNGCVKGPHSRLGARRQTGHWMTGPCEVCGVVFTTRAHSRRFAWGCCPEHQRTATNRRQRQLEAAKYGWSYKTNQSRARRYGVEYEPIRPTEVFARDGYRCGICGEMAERDQKVPHPRAPTLDHVVPMSKGGPHLYSNVQCAHFRCNYLKSDTVDEQLSFAA